MTTTKENIQNLAEKMQDAVTLLQLASKLSDALDEPYRGKDIIEDVEPVPDGFYTPQQMRNDATAEIEKLLASGELPEHLRGDAMRAVESANARMKQLAKSEVKFRTENNLTAAEVRQVDALEVKVAETIIKAFPGMHLVKGEEDKLPKHIMTTTRYMKVIDELLASQLEAGKITNNVASWARKAFQAKCDHVPEDLWETLEEANAEIRSTN